MVSISRPDIVIVDDNEADVRLLEELLTERGLSVATALHGQVGLDLVAREIEGPRDRPLLVVLDLNMPKMDGFSFVKALRATPGWAECRVVIMSGSDAPEDVMTAYRLGVRQYFKKPTNLQGWSATVEDLERFIKVMD